MRILIVDDEPAIVTVLSRQLRGNGCLVWSAGNCEEALALAGKERFDVILLDLVLPGMSGFGMISMLKNVSEAAILAMTGRADEEIRTDVKLLGAAELIEKPFQFQELMPMIRDMSFQSSRPCGGRGHETGAFSQ